MTATIEQKPEAPSITSNVRGYAERVRGGDMGALPAVLGLIVLCTVFAIMRPSFFTAGNFANLFTQGAAVTVIAMGLVFVLLLGEIDLSAGFASGVCAAVLAILLAEQGQPWYVAALAAIAVGTVIGVVLGTLVAKLGILLRGDAGRLPRLPGPGPGAGRGRHEHLRPRRDDPGDLQQQPLARAELGDAGHRGRRLRRDPAAAGPQAEQAQPGLRPDLADRGPGGALAALGGLAVYVLNLERSRNAALVSLKGVPVVVPIIIVLLVVWTFVLRRTAFGRHLYAVGGNAEAARRAGINVDRMKISAFVICSSMAAVGGIIAASRASSVDPNTGGSNVLLYAVGAAVIGGTSLFGGKGRVLDAVLGGAVVAVIENGMGLMGYGSDVKFIVTGSVLLLAASVDALSRKRAAATGLR
nr:hypothetical protein GCM10020093_041260 [Planobispora longispora]